MKRIILSVFAAAVTAAWAVPASAGDVTFSGQYRLRGEFTQSADYNDATTPDSVDSWTQRVRLTANAKATDDVSAKITIQDTRTWGSMGAGGLLTESGQAIDLHEAYLNVNGIFGTPINFRAGRQELAYGDERLIGSFGWSNQGRAFEGVKFNFNNDAVNVDAFATTIVEDSTNDIDQSFNGVYATLKQLVPNNTLDVYFLHNNDGAMMTRYTLGARLKGAVSGIDYTAELPYQFGENTTTQDISAWALAVKAGYTLPTPMNVRIGVEYDYATGNDTDPAETEAFANLYPTNHNHFGIGDVINTWSDIMAWSINASADINEKTKATVAYWSYTENEVAAGAPDDLGSEIDVIVTHKYNNAVSLEAGLAHFVPGDATTGVGNPNDPREWAYLQITANF